MAGRCTTETVTKTEYIQGETISGTISNIEPVHTETPERSTLPVKIDTVFVDNIRYVTQHVDTAAIIREYELKRYYSETLFNNQYGKLDVSFTSQYNKVTDLKYDFTPVTIVRTVEKERVFTPFVMASYNTLKQGGIGGGIFYHDIGVQVRFVTDFKANGLDVGIMYKF
ncbi:MAG: hypothetical protein LBB84_07995 [Tannerellaceae bacterium]|nr:hypothetical protein [Tannerellaceae bacterium]